MKSDFISYRVILYLTIIVIISLIFYFKISDQPRIEDLFINLAATVLGIIITLLLVDRSIKKDKAKEWQEFKGIISKQILDIIFSLCNYSNISTILWQQYLEIFKEDVDTKNKIVKYIDFYNESKIDLDYITQIIKDEHLIGFFLSGYTGILHRLDDVYKSYSNNLTADQSTQIIQLKSNLTTLISNMNRFHTTNFAIKEFNVPLETSYLNDFKVSVSETITTMNKLINTV